MAADEGWYQQWFAGAWFPPVWFAPADETAVPPEELQPPPGAGAGLPVRKSRRSRGTWSKPVAPAVVSRRVEEAETLHLLGIL